MGTRALPLVVRPRRGETALSVMSGLADVNGIGLPAVAEHVAGRRRPDGWEDEHWAKLASLLSVPVDRLDCVRTRPAGVPTAPSAVTMLDHPIHPWSLVTDRLRICPECVGRFRLLKESWRLVHSVCCSLHGHLLIDTCRCGRPLDVVSRAHPRHSHRAHDGAGAERRDPFSCVCGLPFADNVAPKASIEAMSGADWIDCALGDDTLVGAYSLALLNGRELAEPFRSMRLYDVMAVVDTIGHAAATQAEEDEPIEPQRYFARSGVARSLTLDQCVLHVEAAMKVLANWPAAYHTLLADVAGRNTNAGSRLPTDLFATRIGQTLVKPRRGLDGLPIGVLQEEVDAFLVARGYTLRQKVPTRSSATARAIAGTMPCSKVARSLGLSKAKTSLKLVYREVTAAFDGQGGDHGNPARLGAAVLKEIKARLARADDVVSASDASSYLCNETMKGRSGNWEHPDLLVAVNADPVIRPRLKEKAFPRVEVERMRKLIARAARPVGRDAIPEGFRPYGEAAKLGTQKAYTGVLLTLDIVNGHIPSVRVIDKPRLSDLFLEVAAVRLRSLEAQLTAMLEREQFAGKWTCQGYLDRLWPECGEKLTVELGRELRDAGSVRFETRTNTTEGRTRPLYWYSIRDLLARWQAVHGPSLSAVIDARVALPG